MKKSLLTSIFALAMIVLTGHTWGETYEWDAEKGFVDADDNPVVINNDFTITATFTMPNVESTGSDPVIVFNATNADGDSVGVIGMRHWKNGFGPHKLHYVVGSTDAESGGHYSNARFYNNGTGENTLTITATDFSRGTIASSTFRTDFANGGTNTSGDETGPANGSFGTDAFYFSSVTCYEGASLTSATLEMTPSTAKTYNRTIITASNWSSDAAWVDSTDATVTAIAPAEDDNVVINVDADSTVTMNASATLGYFEVFGTGKATFVGESANFLNASETAINTDTDVSGITSDLGSVAIADDKCLSVGASTTFTRASATGILEYKNHVPSQYDLNLTDSTVRFAGTAEGEDMLGGTNGKVEIGEGAQITVPHLRFLNTSANSNRVTLDVNGTLTVNTETTDPYGERASYKGILFGHWHGQGVYNINAGGSLIGEKTYLMTVFTAESQAINIKGGTMQVRALVANNANSSITLSDGGTLKLATWPNTGAITQNYGYGTLAAYVSTSDSSTTGWTNPQAVSFTDAANGTTLDPNGLTIAFTGAVTDAVEGGGALLVVEDSSESKNGVVDLANAATLPDTLRYVVKSGTLILPAGAEGADGNAYVTTDGGTLRLMLTEAQTLAGYTAQVAEGSNVEFYDNNGNALSGDTVSGNTYTPALNTWTTGDTSGSWDAIANWSNDAVPTSEQSAKISITQDTEITLSADVTIANLVVTGTGKLTVSGEGKFIVTSEVVLETDVAVPVEKIASCGRISIADGKTMTVSSSMLIDNPDRYGADSALTLPALSGSGSVVKEGDGSVAIFGRELSPAITVKAGDIHIRSNPTTRFDVTAESGTFVRLTAWNTNFSNVDNKITLKGGSGLVLGNGAYSGTELAGTITIADASTDSAKIYGSAFTQVTIAAAINGEGTLEFADGERFGYDGDTENYPCRYPVIVSGVISGGINVKVTELANTVTFTGTNTYTGGTEIAEGATLQVAGLGNLGASGDVNIAEGGKLNIYVTGNTQDHGQAWNRLKGNGTVAYNSNGSWHTFPTIAKSFPTTLTVENNLATGLILPEPAQAYKIGSLQGTGAFRVDFGGNDSNPRSLEIIQSKNTTFSGGMIADYQNGRLSGFYLSGAEGAENKTLTYSGTTTLAKPMTVNASGVLNLTGSWTGAMTVAGTIGGTGTIGGALTLNAGAIVDATAGALTVSGDVTLPTDGTVTVNVAADAAEGDTVLTCAAGDLAMSSFVCSNEAYVLKANDAGTAVVLATPVANTASANGVEYATIEEAVNAVKTATVKTVTIIADSEEAVVLPQGVTLAVSEGVNYSGAVTDEYGTAISLTDGAYTCPVYEAAITVDEKTTGYASLQAAVNAAQDGETIQVLTSLTLTDTVTLDDANKAITINLNSGMHSSTAATAIQVTNGMLTLKNGAITGTGVVVQLGTKNGATTSKLVVEADASLMSMNYALVDGEYVVDGDNVVLMYGVATLETAGILTTYSSEYAAVQGSGGDLTANTTIKVTGGTIASENNHAIYHPQPGTLTITDGEISGVTGIEMRAGTLEMEDGTVTATGEYDAPGANSNGSTVEGAAIVLSQHVTGENVTANITGGTITATSGKTFVVANTTGADPVDVEATLAGGVGVTPDTAEVLIDTLELTTDSDGNYSLTKVAVTYVAQIGDDGEKFTSVTDALKAATSGDTVKLLADVTEVVVVPAGFTGTLDLGGKTLTGRVIATGAEGALITATVQNGSIYNEDSSKDAVIVEAYSTVTLKELNVTGTKRHIVRVNAGGNCIVESGTYTLVRDGAGCNILYLAKSGAQMTVKGGTFVGQGGTYEEAQYIYAFQLASGTALYVEGGNFTLEYQNLFEGASESNSIEVSGGTFKQDPSGYLVPGYMSVNYNSLYEVLPNTGSVKVEAESVSEAEEAVSIALAPPAVEGLSITPAKYSTYFKAKAVLVDGTTDKYMITPVLNPDVVTPTIAESTEGANDAIVIAKDDDGNVTKVTLTVSNALPGLYYGVAIMPSPSSAVEDYVMNSTPYTGTAKDTTTVDFEAADSDADDVAKLTDAAVFFKVLVDFED